MLFPCADGDAESMAEDEDEDGGCPLIANFEYAGAGLGSGRGFWSFCMIQSSSLSFVRSFDILSTSRTRC